MCWRRYKARSQAGPYVLFQGLGWMGLESVGSLVQLIRLKVGFGDPILLVFYIFFMWIWKLHTPPNQPSPRTPWQTEEHTEEMYWGVLRAISTPPNFQWLITVLTDKKNLSIRALPYQPLAPPGFRRGHHSQPRPPRPCTAVSNIMRTLQKFSSWSWQGSL